MNMNSSDSHDCPDLFWYLFLEFPALPSKKPKVWEAFKRYAHPPPFLPDFMAYGAPPLVRPEKGFLACENDGDPKQQADGSYIQRRTIKWYGLTPIGKGYILIASDLCQMAGLPAGGDILEATLLHELIHYCRQMRGIEKDDIRRGMVVCAPGSITPHTEFKAEVYVLSKEEGGRHTPFFNKYRPQFYLRTTDVTGEVELPQGVEMVMPGDNISMTVKLITPVAMEKGLRFAIREGGRTVGAGQVTEILK